LGSGGTAEDESTEPRTGDPVTEDGVEVVTFEVVSLFSGATGGDVGSGAGVGLDDSTGAIDSNVIERSVDEGITLVLPTFGLSVSSAPEIVCSNASSKNEVTLSMALAGRDIAGGGVTGWAALIMEAEPLDQADTDGSAGADFAAGPPLVLLLSTTSSSTRPTPRAASLFSPLSFVSTVFLVTVVVLFHPPPTAAVVVDVEAHVDDVILPPPLPVEDVTTTVEASSTTA
jgi:hypothetical protein